MSSSMFFKLFLFALTFVSCLASKNPVEFYKLSLQWSRSTCNSGQIKCETPLPSQFDQQFTIHGLWPQDAKDQPVDPYSSNPTCVPTPPTPIPTTSDLQKLLGTISSSLDDKWPNLQKDPISRAGNLVFWLKEWDKHGTCSDFAHDPENYFKTALQIRGSLPDLGIKSGQTPKVQDVINSVKNIVGAKPELACNRNSTGTTQLWEIRFCYNRPDPQGLHLLRDCPFGLSPKPPCSNLQGTIYVP